jgi:hypothetical protein
VAFSAYPAGDVNGDGFADILVTGGPTALYLYLGSASGISATPAKTLGAPAGVTSWGDVSGGGAAMLGDVNGDGYGDVALFGNNTNPGQAGRNAFVYLGSAAGLPAAPSETVACDFYGYYGDIGGGDINADGYSDFVCGADQTGNLSFFPGSSAGLPTTATTTFADSGRVFTGLVPVGDLNNDGYADFMAANSSALAADTYTITFLGGPSFPSSESAVFNGYIFIENSTLNR